MKRALRIPALAVLLVFSTSSAALAAEQTMNKEHIFHSRTPEFSYEAKETIEEDGRAYVLQGVTYETVSEEDLYVSKEAAYEGLAEKKVPLKKNFKINGKTVTLQANEAEIRYRETVETSTETLSGYTSAPSLPKEKTVSMNGKAYKATLAGVQETKTSKPFTARVKFLGDQHADFYFNGKKIKLHKTKPTWDNYQRTVAKHLNLETGSVLTGGSWTGGWQKEKGRMVRYAQFTGTRPASNYTAAYTFKQYSAVVTYDNGAEPGAKDYTVKAICEYERKGMSTLQKVIFAGVGLLLLAGLVILALYFIGKRKENKKNQDLA